MCKTTMIKNKHISLQDYESPRIETTFCEAWSGICAQSVVTEVTFNQIVAEEQESGVEVDFEEDTFNHSWEDVVEQSN